MINMTDGMTETIMGMTEDMRTIEQMVMAIEMTEGMKEEEIMTREEIKATTEEMKEGMTIMRGEAATTTTGDMTTDRDCQDPRRTRKTSTHVTSHRQ